LYFLLPLFIFHNIKSENPAAAVTLPLLPGIPVKPVTKMKAKAVAANRKKHKERVHETHENTRKNGLQRNG
jgi:hypothetical protein